MDFIHWEQAKAPDMILDQCSASYTAHSRAWNGNAHRRADVARRRAYILESMLH